MSGCVNRCVCASPLASPENWPPRLAGRPVLGPPVGGACPERPQASCARRPVRRRALSCVCLAGSSVTPNRKRRRKQHTFISVKFHADTAFCRRCGGIAGGRGSGRGGAIGGRGGTHMGGGTQAVTAHRQWRQWRLARGDYLALSLIFCADDCCVNEHGLPELAEKQCAKGFHEHVQGFIRLQVLTGVVNSDFLRNELQIIPDHVEFVRAQLLDGFARARIS